MYNREGQRIWLVVFPVALSHFLLDGLVHVAGLPLAGEHSPKLGLGLWNYMPLELSLETLMAITGLAPGGFVVIVAALTWTQLMTTAPPTTQELNVSWIVVPLVFSGIANGFDWKGTHQAAVPLDRSQNHNLHPSPEI